jgi:hypothetical protein
MLYYVINMSYISHCELCTGKGSGGYAPLEQIASASSYSSASYSDSSGYSSSPAVSYSMKNQGYSSNLEYAVFNSEISAAKEISSGLSHPDYRKKKYFQGYLTNSRLTQSYSSNSPFILQDIETKFIGDVKDISEHIEDSFRKVTGESFPDDLIIHVCSRQKLKEFHNGFSSSWNEGITGFAVNRKKHGLKSEIFVCQGELANVLATIGHEIGHCISAPLDNLRDEEAKAFAFEFAWLKAINDNNIAELKGCFSMNDPAKNNVHDKAFEFVFDAVRNGADSLKLCFGLAGGDIKAGSDFL